MRYFILVLLALLFAGSTFAGEYKIVAPVTLLLLQDDSRWGAEPIGDEHRPEKVWLGQFDSPDAIVPVETTLTAAIDSCPDAGSCVVQLNKSIVLPGVQFIDRPKTKIIGLNDNNTLTFENNGAGGSFIEIGSNTSEIVIENLVFDGDSVNYGNNEIFAIFVSGENIDKVAIKSNVIHHIYSNEDAHGIAIYGEGSTENSAIQNVIIENNIVHDMKTGSSESIVVNGNVKNWEIIANEVVDVNNIAIDAIGGEGTVAPHAVNDRMLPHALDAARYGFIENNTVTRMSTVGNGAYGGGHSWAGAIYVDGAHHLYIADNEVVDAEWAYDIGAENCVVSGNVTLENNTASNSYYGDFLIGGYAEIGFKDPPVQAINCNPTTSVDADEGHGYVENVTVKNNTFRRPTEPPPPDFENTTELAYRIRQAVIIQTGVAEDHPNGIANGDENSIRVTE
jgi:hypothetical protein